MMAAVVEMENVIIKALDSHKTATLRCDHMAWESYCSCGWSADVRPEKEARVLAREHRLAGIANALRPLV